MIRTVKRFLVKAWHLPRNIGCLLIRGYQKTFSPDHGVYRIFFPHGFCRYTPSCSEYTYLAIKKYGLIWGSIKGLWRILRCNPCSKGGIDIP